MNKLKTTVPAVVQHFVEKDGFTQLPSDSPVNGLKYVLVCVCGWVLRAQSFRRGLGMNVPSLRVLGSIDPLGAAALRDGVICGMVEIPQGIQEQQLRLMAYGGICMPRCSPSSPACLLPTRHHDLGTLPNALLPTPQGQDLPCRSAP